MKLIFCRAVSILEVSSGGKIIISKIGKTGKGKKGDWAMAIEDNRSGD
jgi:hypothetical protein